jgi:Rrf2 family protein
MLSLTCQTAIKAVIFLASKIELDEKMGIPIIATEIGASVHTVGKLLQTLVKAGVIESSKGPTGGFYMTKAQLKQPILQIVMAIDGADVFKRCGLGLSKCAATHPCPIHYDYKEVRDRFELICKNRKIADLCAPLAKGVSFLIG